MAKALTVNSYWNTFDYIEKLLATKPNICIFMYSDPLFIAGVTFQTHLR